MKKTITYLCPIIFVLSILRCSYSSPWDFIKSKLNTVTSTKLSDSKIGAGLKEALSVGIKNTIALLGKNDGYFANQAIKVLLPDGIKKMEPALRRIGLGPKLDEFTLSMNRAAEKAAPQAADIFSSAITDISFDDVQKIFQGGNTAATEYLKAKTSKKLLAKFAPVVQRAMDDYAVTKRSEEILSKAQTIPLVGKYASGIDINKYVSSKALDGLFLVLGQQENKIRTEPAARVTDLLKEVFK
ncbi:MAG: DUF4197 domain-containing protein [Syntrophales bacterium LBB04]|nr:DUF4197 domain-containing protein [Syntrophales bacterium LBB04]